MGKAHAGQFPAWSCLGAGARTTATSALWSSTQGPNRHALPDLTRLHRPFSGVWPSRARSCRSRPAWLPPAGPPEKPLSGNPSHTARPPRGHREVEGGPHQGLRCPTTVHTCRLPWMPMLGRKGHQSPTSGSSPHSWHKAMGHRERGAGMLTACPGSPGFPGKPISPGNPWEGKHTWRSVRPLQRSCPTHLPSQAQTPGCTEDTQRCLYLWGNLAVLGAATEEGGAITPLEWESLGLLWSPGAAGGTGGTSHNDCWVRPPVLSPPLPTAGSSRMHLKWGRGRGDQHLL